MAALLPYDRAALTISAAVVALAAVGQTFRIELVARQSDTNTVVTAAAPITADAPAPISPRTRTAQVLAWLLVGGDDLLSRSDAYLSDRSAPDADIHALCTELVGIAQDSAAFFRIPDPRIQPSWQQFITQALAAGDECSDESEAGRTSDAVSAADQSLRETLTRIDAESPALTY
ncbi:hypothetical protein [Nocardia sp. NPDC020380]|uniref:hypothetical protein n=1 Tax=Nocardia sp. NPDC020380 TaxID=3364309 RepID=UPI00378E4D3B